MRPVIRFVLAGLSLLGAACALAQEAPPAHRPLKVLVVGNSFSISATHHLPAVAADLGCALDLCSLYIGGCSLARHMKNVRAAGDPAFAPYVVDWYRVARTEKGAFAVSGGRRQNANLPQMLASNRWDIVTIQQVSGESWRRESYHPDGDDLVRTIRRLAPGAEIVVQQTWSYTPWDCRLAKWKLTPETMYEKLADAYAAFAKGYSFRLIPMGAAVQAWRAALPVTYTENSFGGDVVGGRGKSPERQFKRKDGKWVPDSDCFHLNDSGNYFQALVWAAFLFDADVTRCGYRPDFVSPDRAQLMKKVAFETVRRERAR